VTVPKPSSRQAALPILQPTDSAWACGFVEGEGCIAITTTASWRFVYIQVTQSEPGKEALVELHRLFGGTLYQARSSTQTFAGNHPLWAWHLQSQSQVRRFLEAIQPYMHHPVKRDKATLALELLGRKLNEQKHKWTPEEDDLLRREYKRGKAEALAVKLSRTVQSITSRTVVLGLSEHPHSTTVTA
jgi:hypothetical protein